MEMNNEEKEQTLLEKQPTLPPLATYYQVTETTFSIILSSKLDPTCFSALLACSTLLSRY